MKSRNNLLCLLLLGALAVSGCSPEQGDGAGAKGRKGGGEGMASAMPPSNPERNAYFGDLHVHTVYSFDAYIFGTRASPDDAYRFAQGAALRHPAGFDMQLEEPLDFYAVTDHGAFLGVIKAMGEPASAISKHADATVLSQHETTADRRTAFQSIFKYVHQQSEAFGEIHDLDVIRAAWSNIKDSANRNNDPGKFTTFIGYEYTSGPDFQNLHRNVIFKGSRAPEVPFSRIDSSNPEDLWRWMDRQRRAGMESFALPHNSNGSNGLMFSLRDFAGNPLTAAYANLRMRNEPLVENTQIKGTSDTHPMLSPNDEWADFEIMPNRVASTLASEPRGSYAREALLNGITLWAKQGFNPFKFGVVGASDTHNATWSGNDDNYYSKVGMLDSDGQKRGSVPLHQPDEQGNRYVTDYYHYWGGSGLAGVWAEQNTRDAIYAAFRRKETFSTTGPRIKVRFFAGRALPSPHSPTMVRDAYQAGVSMGGDLAMMGPAAPEFIIWATQDPKDAPLQRAQVIKGWVEKGEPKEQVYDVACSNGAKVNPSSHRCPDNNATVDLATCTPRGRGAAELKVKWQDPDFDAATPAFYYVRVLQNPTCRWSTWDAIRAKVPPREDLHATIQERAWSSPIWYSPMRR